MLPELGGHAALTDKFAIALVRNRLRSTLRKGGYIAEGYDAALDALRSASSDGRRAIAGARSRYRDATGVASLKIRHNAVLGYHIEVPARHADRLMAPDSGFTHRQTLAGVVRFNSPDLHAEAARVVEAGGQRWLPKQPISRSWRARVASARHCSDRRCDRPDRCCRRATRPRAAEGGWCLPTLTDQPCLEIEGGRHPVVEEHLALQASASLPMIAPWARRPACG